MIDFSVEDGVAVVAFNRPERLNALNPEMRQALGDHFEAISVNDDIRAVVLTGRGGAFCSGADVGAMGGATGGGKAMTERRKGLQWGSHRAIRALYRIEKPTVAAVNGAAAGVGWGYALACDVVIASPDAKFTFAQVRRGLAPDGGSIFFLTRRVSHGVARELVFSARSLPAAEAKALGVIDHLSEESDALLLAMTTARRLAEGPTFAIGQCKRLFDASTSMGFDQFIELELQVIGLLGSTEDHREGVDAFKERRPARFKGR
ncbi:MAG TPA: enoyl-CoA hydratase/isomerase family protein [Bryobacteraceae bacterium]|nr:enoyl-CoA hydratase/isomerase family protein [Bryobacteraceae bacterium]